MSQMFYRRAVTLAVLLGSLLSSVACQRSPEVGEQATVRPPGITKNVSFSVLEDYDKGDDLDDIARDFQLMQELEVDVMRCSFGWDDYETSPGQYDFAWVEEFVSLAAQYDIKLRPYIAYTPAWAGKPGSDDGSVWNNPPADQKQWYDFVFALASALSDHPNLLSYEIYNEENTEMWWDGTNQDYQETLRQAALAIRKADPDAQVLLGGMTSPDDDWIRPLVEGDYTQYYDITPLHVYNETWDPRPVESYFDRQYKDFFLPLNNTDGEAEPIWINETGFATKQGKTEEQQANWWARAVSTFLAEPEVEHIGIYEIKDLPKGSDIIGDDTNYYLGITTVDRTKKLAFHTLDMLTDLLAVDELMLADKELTVTPTSGDPGQLYHHLFVRPDGRQVLFVYDKRTDLDVRVRLERSGSSAHKYELDGASAPFRAFDGQTLDLQLVAGEVAILVIDP